MVLKRTVIDALVVIAAVVGVTFLLKKGEEAGASRMMQIATSPGNSVAPAAPLRPQTIAGRIDNFKDEAIPLKPIRSWGADLKYAIMLGVSGNPKLNQPSARVVLAQSVVQVSLQTTATANSLASDPPPRSLPACVHM